MNYTISPPKEKNGQFLKIGLFLGIAAQLIREPDDFREFSFNLL